MISNVQVIIPIEFLNWAVSDLSKFQKSTNHRIHGSKYYCGVSMESSCREIVGSLESP